MTVVAYGQLTHGSSLWLIPSSNLESWVPIAFPGTPQKRPLAHRTRGPSTFLTKFPKVSGPVETALCLHLDFRTFSFTNAAFSLV